jgi:hypothetical protein
MRADAVIVEAGTLGRCGYPPWFKRVDLML